MVVTFETLIKFIIDHIEQARKSKGNMYYVVDDVISAINQIKNIRTFYHTSDDNKYHMLTLVKKIFEKDGVANPATPNILYKEIEQLIISIYAIMNENAG